MQGLKMEIVADNSEKDLQLKRAQGEIHFALRALTANLFRVTRGAGKPGEIVAQTVELRDALALFVEAAKHLPPADALQAALNIQPELRDRRSIVEDFSPGNAAGQNVIRG